MNPLYSKRSLTPQIFILFLESIIGKMIPKSIAKRNEVSQSIIAIP